MSWFCTSAGVLCIALAGSLASVSVAQQPAGVQQAPPAAKPAAPRPAAPKPAAPNPAPPNPAPPKSAAAKPTAPAPAATGTDTQTKLLGQYADWGAYTASPGGSKVCFALARPKNSKTEPPGRTRDPSYMFVSIRPAESVKNEISVVIGYPFKTSSDATAEIGTARFPMYTQNDGAWIKNVTEEARLVDTMRKGGELTVKGTSGRGTQSVDQYSLKGLAQALDKLEQECR